MEKERAAHGLHRPAIQLRIEGNVTGLGAVQHRDFAMASGEMNEAQFTAFLDPRLHAARPRQHGWFCFIIYAWTGDTMSELPPAGREVYSELKNLCVWAKDNGGMGSLYRSQHELIFVFKLVTARIAIMFSLASRSQSQQSLALSWREPRRTLGGGQSARAPSHREAGRPGGRRDHGLHRARRVVLDAFLGAAQPVIAAERVGRRRYGIELDPPYVDTIIRRWQAFTGDEARHALSNRSFKEIEAEVEEKEMRGRKSGDYEVGYGKPPRETKVQAGAIGQHSRPSSGCSKLGDTYEQHTEPESYY